MTTAPARLVETRAPAEQLPDRLPFVEGLRGVAATVVVVGHCVTSCGYLPQWPGTAMVYLFLVISGFSLAYSEQVRRARGGSTSLRVFALRRAWRILPTYYLGMGLGLAVLAVIPRHLIAGVPSLSPIRSTWGGQLSHLLLVHNLHVHWLYQDNGPLWSIAYEAQAYLFFPLLFAASRRVNAALVAAVAICLNLGVRHFEPSVQFAGLLGWFALGVGLFFATRSAPLRRIPTGVLVLLTASAVLAALLGKGRLATVDGNALMWGAAFTLGLLAMSRRPASAVNPANLRAVRWVGARSYSLYALHFPVLWLVYGWLAAQDVSAPQRLALLLVVGLPLCLAVAALGYWAVERPALRKVRSAGPRTSAVSPAASA